MDVNGLGIAATGSAAQFSPGGISPAVTATPQPVPTPAPAPVAAAGIVASGAGNTQQTQQKSAPPSLADVQKAVNNINASLAANGNADAVQFAVDPSSKRIVVQVLDPQTGKVIRQVPSEEIIQMGMALGQKLGQVINQQA